MKFHDFYNTLEQQILCIFKQQLKSRTGKIFGRRTTLAISLGKLRHGK